MIVAGGGVTGLVVCHELAERGVDVRLLEAAPRVGGVIRSVEREGRILDLGPQRTRLTGGVRRLVGALGLAKEVVEAPADLPLYVYRERALRRVPMDLPALIRTDLLSWRGKLRMLLEPLTGPPHTGETVAEFLERAFGREAYLHLFGPLYAGIYASDPRRMPAEYSLRRALEQHGARRSVLLRILRWRLGGGSAPPAVSFRAGMEALPRALHRRLGDRIRTGRRVTSVVREAGGFRIETEEGAPVRAGTVVLSVPADAAGGILEAAAPETASVLGRLRYNPLVVVHLRSEWDREGYGFQVSLSGRDRAVRGVTWNYSLFGEAGREGVSTAYLGGATRPEVAALDDREVSRRAADEFTEVTGVPARPVHVHRTRMPAFDETWQGLGRLRRSSGLPEGIHLCGSYQVRPGIPGRILRATSLARRIAGEYGSAERSHPTLEAP